MLLSTTTRPSTKAARPSMTQKCWRRTRRRCAKDGWRKKHDRLTGYQGSTSTRSHLNSSNSLAVMSSITGIQVSCVPVHIFLTVCDEWPGVGDDAVCCVPPTSRK
jgi:hypothetical protein